MLVVLGIAMMNRGLALTGGYGLGSFAGREINACNRTIEVPAVDLTIEVRPGEQTVRLDPLKDGALPWSCSMGMLRGSFAVRRADP
jgi:hypothetical protein